MDRGPELDALWDEFHHVVNMPSRELRDFLAADSAGEETEELPDEVGDPTGHQVLEILGRRKVDLTERDLDVMRTVIDLVYRLRGDELDREVSDDDTRRLLMGVGHDPLADPDRRYEPRT